MLINRGVQSLAIRVSSRWILKMPNSTRTARHLWRRWHANEGRHDEQQIALAAAKSLDDRKLTIAYVKMLSKRDPDYSRYFGNPRFFAYGIYAQEYARVLSNVVHNQDRQANAALFEAYAQAILSEWRYGFSDIVFNFTANSGLDKSGRIVLFDFGDITFDLAEIQEAIRTKHWLRSWTYLHDMSDDCRDDFADIMRRTITLANLKRNWRAALR